VDRSDDDLLRATLAAVAPGTDLRDGLERILRGRTGALIVLGQDRVVDSMASGGFPLDVEFSSTRLRELAKMDGAIILDRDGTRILRAAAQLLPDPSIETSESGTRHRTAERVAKQTGFPVVSVSQSMQIVALYVGGRRHVLEGSAAILSRANQALQTLERYKNRLDVVSASLSALEVEDLVTVRDVVSMLQRSEMVRRIAEEVEEYVVELGTDGRLILLQLEELMGGVEDDRHLVIRDYLRQANGWTLTDALDRLAATSTEDLLDLKTLAWVLHIPTDAGGLDASLQPRGSRLLSRIPRLPDAVIQRVIEHFGDLPSVMRASVEELDDVEGVGAGRAKAIKEGLSRLAESSILDRYS
jgi:diadenylate cyclase